MRIEIVTNMSVSYKGEHYTPDTGPFEIDEADEALVVALGSNVRVVTEDGDPVPTDPVPLPSFPTIQAAKLRDLPSITPELHKALIGVGIETPQRILDVDVVELTRVKGIGKATAKKLVKEARAAVALLE